MRATTSWTAVLLLAAFGWTLPALGQDDPCAFPLPLPSKIGEAAFEAKLYAFLDNLCYEKLGWVADRERRDTGPWIQGSSYGSHPAVRVWYSPEAWAWLEGGRKGSIADGGLIVKAMYNPPARHDNPLSGWTFMSRDSQASWDGWFWGYHGVPTGEEGTSLDARRAEIGYPDSGFGLYCLNCHASADNDDNTYITKRNVDGEPMTYLLVDPSMNNPTAATEDLHLAKGANAPQMMVAHHRAKPDPEFLKVFPEMKPVPLTDVVPFPGEGLDNVVSGPPPAGPQQFLTSSQCIGCHDATQSNAAPPNLIYPAQGSDGPIVNLSPYGEWRASMMGLAGRDPIFFAQLESELALHPQHRELIQNTCFKCHGVLGQRQLAIDTGGKETFKEEMVFAKPPSAQAEYGALARDGVSCTACHHIAAEGLGTPSTFTGNFNVGPANELYGPYADVQTLPMDHALGITPKEGKQIQSAALCGSCHAIKLPVFDASGKLVKETFEQTTYLEWLNSNFQNEVLPFGSTVKTCQDCHLPTTYNDQQLAYRIANIEDDTFPFVDNRAPDKDLNLKVREPYHRHMLAGINLFGIEMFQQFAEILGIRTVDPMATWGNPVAPLLTAEQSMVELATGQTAQLTIPSVATAGGSLEVKVQVANLAGHHLPSGVGFRRAFLTFEVLDGAGKALWTSGRTSNLGLLLGPDGNVLPTEFFERIDGKQVYQPHWEVIERQDQVQIYEELVADCSGNLTTSFLAICEHVKDNRLQPQGWRKSGPYADDTRPWGSAERDCDYRFRKDCSGPSKGVDVVTYRVPQSAIPGAASVRVSLSYQAIPPYYLKDRFTWSKGPDGQRLYAFASYLNTRNTPIEGWKIGIASAKAAVPTP
ncbi:MAG TPA: hypothetical protein VF017_02005 [Thermoanaerobaculia bacterium]|nr:hypothetical protein [Thermoanaerobaculia bacterium]